VGGRARHATARFWDTVGGELQRAVEAVAGRGITVGGRRQPSARSPGHPRADGVVPGPGAARCRRRRAGAYTDTPGTTHAAAIDAVTEAGIAGGFEDGTFRPDEVVTRGQLATFRAARPGVRGCTPAPFTDVAGSPHEPAICAVAGARHRYGFPDGSFRPQDGVTRGQTARFLGAHSGSVTRRTTRGRWPGRPRSRARHRTAADLHRAGAVAVDRCQQLEALGSLGPGPSSGAACSLTS
jgi:hypothetical protein